MNPITQNRIAYETAGTEYEKYYFDEQTGGYVLIHQGHNRGESFTSEVFVAESLARQGSAVELVNERGEGKKFDAMVNGQDWEFKELKASTENILSAIQAGVRKGKYQSGQIAYHINRILNPDELEMLNRGIKNALRWDKEKQVKVLMLVNYQGHSVVLTRKELDYGKVFECSNL